MQAEEDASSRAAPRDEEDADGRAAPRDEEDGGGRAAPRDEDEAPQQQPAATAPTTAGKPQRNRQMEHYHRIRESVRKAVAAKHTFMIHGRARVVREALLARHWCEKLPRKGSPAGEQQLGLDSSPSALLAGVGDLGEPQNERLLVSRMLGGHTPDLLWNAGSDWSGWPAQDNKSTIFNRFSRASFTSKVGLCSSVRQMHWHYEAGVANTLFPRCYNISQAGDQLQAFVEDFRTTACLALLKWLLERAERLDALASSSGLVPLRALDFALGRVGDLVASRCHQDLDREPDKVWSHQWEQFLGWYYKLLHQQATLVAGGASCLHKYVLAARHLLRRVRPFWPQLDMDGCLDVWILKPGNKSRGRGIVLMNRLDDILAKVSPGSRPGETRFVVQKYIERPLLIYETKFDIRQWFLVTSAQPLTVWMYRESYLRFCSQKFSLRDFHESIHLSNNAVQCKYKNSPDREPALPADNMWDVASFKQFLAKRGDPDAWERLIYPGIKQGLVGSLLASQEAMDRRRNSFELYGADFMLMDDYSVWLIEINSHPDMSSSTSVTSRLCRKAMEDIIKVVVDHRENAAADTGDFELIYKQRLSCASQAYLGTGLSLHGTRLQAGAGQASRERDRRSPGGTLLGTSPSALAACRRRPQVAAAGGPALTDLIEELELQLDREFREYVQVRQAGGLVRQVLPPAEAGLLRVSEDPPQVFDVQTNTASRTVDLGLVQSLSGPAPPGDASADRLPSADPRHSARTQLSALGKRRSGSPGKHAHRTNLISKIIDLQKHSSSPRSTAIPFNKLQLSLPLATHHSASNGQLLKPERGATASKPQEKANRLIASKFVPPIPSSMATSSKHKLSNKSRAKEKKVNSARKRNLIATSQMLLDVTDMYAIGLAVSK